MLMEMVIVVSLITVAVLALLSFYGFSLQRSVEKQQQYQAYFLAQQAAEGLRSFRANNAWAVSGLGTLTNDIPYHLTLQGSPADWKVLSGAQTLDGFTQTIIFKAVRRDINNNIVESGGTIDGDSKQAIITISWSQNNKFYQIQLVSLLTNWL